MLLIWCLMQTVEVPFGVSVMVLLHHKMSHTVSWHPHRSHMFTKGYLYHQYVTSNDVTKCWYLTKAI